MRNLEAKAAPGRDDHPQLRSAHRSRMPPDQRPSSAAPGLRRCHRPSTSQVRQARQVLRAGQTPWCRQQRQQLQPPPDRLRPPIVHQPARTGLHHQCDLRGQVRRESAGRRAVRGKSARLALCNLSAPLPIDLASPVKPQVRTPFAQLTRHPTTRGTGSRSPRRGRGCRLPPARRPSRRCRRGRPPPSRGRR